MWRLAIRQFSHDKTRSLLTILAISGAISVILVLRGFEQGLYLQSENAVLHRGAPLFALQAGVANFFVTRSSLPQLARAAVEAVPGVKAAQPLTGLWVIHGEADDKMPLFILVYDPPGAGGPTRIIAGQDLQAEGDIVVDIGFARHFGLHPGDALTLSEYRFHIAGISAEDSALFAPMAFISYDSLLDFLMSSEAVADIAAFPLLSFLLIQLQPGASAAAVARSIEQQVPAVDIYDARALAANDRAVGHELFGPVMGLLVGLSYVIGLLIVGLIIYADVNGRRRSFGVMKALGFRLHHVIGCVAIQSLLLVSAAFPLGVMLAQGVALGFHRLAPVYLVHVLDPVGLWQGLIGIIVITGAGSLLPLRLIAGIDPLLALQTE